MSVLKSGSGSETLLSSDPIEPPQHAEDDPSPIGTGALFIAAIATGCGIGLWLPDAGQAVSGATDPTLLALIFLLFFEVRLGGVVRAFGNLKFLAIAWGANFLIVPMVGFAVAYLVVPDAPLLFAGLMIYFLAPCTDWFLGFTRMAGGDTELGAALIPVNLVTQIVLFPVWLWCIAGTTGLVDFAALPALLVQWFLAPLVLAQALRICVERLLPERFVDGLFSISGQLVPLVLAALILQLFAAHIVTITQNRDVFFLIAVAVALFFTLTFWVGVGLARASGLSYREHALLSMTLGARNAPLMIALTAVAVPNQPILVAVIVFGMLLEIPQLTALKHVLLTHLHPKPRG